MRPNEHKPATGLYDKLSLLPGQSVKPSAREDSVNVEEAAFSVTKMKNSNRILEKKLQVCYPAIRNCNFFNVLIYFNAVYFSIQAQ